MSVGCSCRHLSHSRWRLKIYAELFTPVTSAPSPRASLTRKRCRTYGTDRTLDERHPAVDGNAHATSQNVWTQYGSQSSTGDGARPRRSRAKKWNPYSEQGQSDLKSLVTALRDFKELPSQDGDYKPSKLVKLPDLPQSPILQRRLALKEPPKRHPKPEERPLERDPWAMMLAAPVRMCTATKGRMPISLLTNWGLVKHPENGEVYVMPHSLADIDKLEQMGERQLEQSQGDWDFARECEQQYSGDLQQSDDHQMEQSENYEELEEEFESLETLAAKEASEQPPDTAFVPGAPTDLNPGSVPAIRVLPSKDAMKLLTEHYTYTQRPHDPSYPLETKSNAGVARLLPQHWRERIARARHFESHRKEVEKETGLKDFREAPVEATISIKDLKWQPDMDNRLLDILRRRVVICLSRVVEHATCSRQKLKRRSVVAAPRILGVINNGGSWKFVDGKGSKMQEPEAEEIATFAETEAEDENAFFLETPALPEKKPMEGLRVRPYVLPRLLLYFSSEPADATLMRLSVPRTPAIRSTLNNDESEAASQKPAPLLPPLLPASPEADREDRHTPVFPMRSMLGPQRYAELLEAMRTYESVFASDSKENLLSIRAAADYSDVLFPEIWRLWRYIGGTKCMANVQEEPVQQRRQQRGQDTTRSVPKKSASDNEVSFEEFAAMVKKLNARFTRKRAAKDVAS